MRKTKNQSKPQAGYLQAKGGNTQLKVGPEVEIYSAKVDTYNSRLAQTLCLLPKFLHALLVCAGQPVKGDELVQEPHPNRNKHDFDTRLPGWRQVSTFGGGALAVPAAASEQEVSGAAGPGRAASSRAARTCGSRYRPAPRHREPPPHGWRPSQGPPGRESSARPYVRLRRAHTWAIRSTEIFTHTLSLSHSQAPQGRQV